MRPLSSAEHRDRVSEYLEAGYDSDARLVTGGAASDRDGRASEVDPRLREMREMRGRIRVVGTARWARS
jgi:acyl-CoA reductase-like NAD-dependent aldehyde dehydrogenase